MSALRKPLLWIDLPKSWTIFQQLHLEELILRGTDTNCFLFKHGTPEPTIVMGFSAKPAELLELETVKRDSVPVLRRYTGGGTVIVDQNSVFTSWIMNSSAANSQPYPREIMKWSETIFKPAFDSCLQAAGDEFLLRENDYIIGDRKIGGNAQTITKDRWVHHTSFLWDFTEKNMQYLQLPKKRPEYRQSRAHGDFLRKLGPLIPSGVSAFRSALLNRSKELYEVDILSSESDVENYAADLSAKAKDVPVRTKVEQL